MGDLPRASDLPLAQRVALLSGSTTWLTEPIPPGPDGTGGVGSAYVSDGPHGLRALPDARDLSVHGALPATCFPTAVTLASTWDVDLVREVGRAIGTEALALGVDVVLGPGLNLKRHPLCGRNFEYFSEDPLVSGALAAALVEGIQERGVGTSVKHFAVNNQEAHRFVVDAVVDERTLRELYLAGFEHVVTTARPWTVMAAYNRVNGVHVTESAELLGILRDEWGFDGLVMSDWGAVADRVQGVAAGLDLEMPASQGTWDAEVLAAVADGTLDEAAVTTAAQRVLDLVARSPYGPERTPGHGTGDQGLDEHDALARRVAAAGTVLLANDGILPLAGPARIAVIGDFARSPRFQGAGSSQVNAARVTSALDALRERGVEVDFAPGYDPVHSRDDAALLAEAVGVAREADVAVVFVGLPPVYESEGFDRENLSLPAQHDALVTTVAAANPRTVVVLQNGGPVLMPWRDQVAAIVESYLGGQAGGAAVVDVLFGDAEPAGRLAESFPASLDDVAAAPWFPGDPHQVEYREGLAVGYRHLVTEGIEPAFPFGFGLSYTTFTWTDVRVDRAEVGAGEPVTVRVTVQNTGARAGADVVQVYLHDATGVVCRPRRELAGFASVRLEPGESAEVVVEVPARAFAFWDVRAHGWRTPSGRFDVEVARNASDVVATLPVDVAGDVDDAPEPAGTALVAGDDEAFARRLGRPVPSARPVRPFTRETTVGELEGTAVGRLVGKLVRKGSFPEEGDEVTRLMVERMVSELPLRSAAMFSGGRLSLPAVDAILALADGRPVSAARTLADRALAGVRARRR